MIVNGQEYTVDDLTKEMNFEKNFHQKINDEINLTTYQIEMLKKHNIDYFAVNSLKDLIYLINAALNETNDEELEMVLEEISERDYYENTKK